VHPEPVRVQTVVLRRSWFSHSVTVLVLLLAAAAFAQQSRRLSSVQHALTVDTEEGQVRVVTVAQGLAVPWSLAFLPDGDILVTEREGRLRIIRHGVLDPQPIAGVPHVHARDHGGLLDVEVHPNFAENRLVYLTYAKPGERGATVAIARGWFDGISLTNVHDVFVADAWSTSDLHFGSRMAFGWDGALFVSVGERNERYRAQDLSDHAGAIVRIRDDGSVPPDNPFVGQAGRKAEIYSYGHRNVQGLAIHPSTGVLWASEHGPQGGDEINVVAPGRNYGWPLATFGREYTGETIAETPCRADTEQPQVFWVPSIGVSGITFYTGDRFPAWTGTLLVSALSGRQVQRVLLNTAGSHHRESLIGHLGHRVRDVAQGPDELVYVATDTGMILRIQPVEPHHVSAAHAREDRPGTRAANDLADTRRQ
jgi:aldose sugar dehydrogenase